MNPQTKRRLERLIQRMNSEAANHAAIVEQISFYEQGQMAREVERARHEARMGELWAQFDHLTMWSAAV
ncbi:hypothetical protein ACWEOW_07305 [Monashia sp. NPDC004114]